MFGRVISLIAVLLFTMSFQARADNLNSQHNHEEKIKQMSKDPAIIILSEEINRTPQEAADGLVAIGQTADIMLIDLNEALTNDNEETVYRVMEVARGKLESVSFPKVKIREIFNLIVSARLESCIDMYLILFPEDNSFDPFCNSDSL
jgi:hypothetical protein